MIDERLAALRAAEQEGRDPTCAEETLLFLMERAQAMGARRILEVGAGKGLTSIALARACPTATITAIERDAARAAIARAHFAAFGVRARIDLIEGDAAAVLPCLTGQYDLIFLDAAKVQYRRFFPDCKRLLRVGGVLCSDDVLLFRDGVPQKRRMLAAHIQEYVRLLQEDADFQTQLLPYGMGLAVSERIAAHENEEKGS